MSTQPADVASKKIVNDTVRDGLQSALTDATYALTDPRSTREHDFVVTALPDPDPEYPHIVVSEGGMSGGRADSRVDLNQNDFDVQVQTLGRSTTEAMNLRGQVREWFQANYDTFRSAGWTDVELVSSSPISHEDDVDQKAFQVTYTGELWTET